MDYLKKISIIIEKIESAGRGELAEEVSILRDSSFTSSELLMSVTHSLSRFITNDNVVKDAIESDVIELREYCWSMGLAVQ
jgi:hypothetical protein